MHRWLVVAALLASTHAAAGVADRAHREAWRSVRDPESQLVTRTWIGRSPAPGAMVDGGAAERAARAFLAEHLAEIAPGTASEDLVLAANVVDDCGATQSSASGAPSGSTGTGGTRAASACKRTVSFWQTWRGMRVRGGQLSVVIARDAIFAAQAQAVPYVAIALGPEIAQARDGREVIAVASGAGAFAVRVAEHRVRGTWDEWVGLDGRVLVRENRVRDATSTLVYDVPARRPAMRGNLAARAVTAVVDGSALTTSSDGGFAFAGATASVEAGVVGPRVRVVDAGGATASATLTASDGQPTVWSLASDAEGDAQLSAFVHASIAKERARQLFPSLPWIEQQLVVTVNEPGGACNASSTGDDLHFFAGDATCENSARIADVIYHELGHSVHFQTLIPGVGNYNNALSEGLADFFAASITDDSAIARGYQYDDRPVRELDPVGFEKIAPDDLVPSQHQSGLIIGGALWDLRRLLVERYGAVDGAARTDRVFVGVLQRAPNITSSYLAALVGDDDDGDLGNGTPDQCEIDVAFGRHGLAPATSPSVTRAGALRVDGASVELPIERGALACEPAIVRAELITGGARMDMELGTDAARATLPGTGAVRFAIELVFADGSRLHYPANPADPEYTAFVGDTHELWCERFDSDPRWEQTQTGSVSAWEWGTPQGHAGDPTAAFTGTSVLGTDLSDDGRYAGVSETFVSSPLISTLGPLGPLQFREIHLQYRRWLVVEDAQYDQASVKVGGTEVWRNASGPDGFLTHQDREWRFVDHDITALAAQPFALSWLIAADATRSLGGWTLDDVCVVGVDKTPVCGDHFLDEGEECDSGASTCSDTCEIVDLDSCCSVGGSPRGALALALGVLALVGRRRRR